MHEPTHAEHRTSHLVQKKVQKHAQKHEQAQVRNQALDATRSHNCLQENCSKDTTALSEIVAPSHAALFITWYEGNQFEGKYAAHKAALTSSDVARAPPTFAPPDASSKTDFESPLTRFDRLII